MYLNHKYNTGSFVRLCVMVCRTDPAYSEVNTIMFIIQSGGVEYVTNDYGSVLVMIILRCSSLSTSVPVIICHSSGPSRMIAYSVLVGNPTNRP